jgi:glycosyltransferase involved in cell wall biosynthesis
VTCTDDNPQISVCVSTRNRAHLLSRLLRALEGQTLEPGQFEVVVTDDASTDDTGRVLDELKARSKLRIKVNRCDSCGGPGAGRNLAWRSASGPLIAFTDDDCVPTPGWLEAHLVVMASADISQGKVLPNPAQTPGAGSGARYMGVVDENGLYETANICYRRSWLEKLSGFDTTFRLAAGEDTDLAWRAKGAGASTAFASDALVYHDVERFSWRRELRYSRRWEAVVELVDRYPELRPRFGDGPTWRDAHRPAVLAVGGLLAAGGGAATRKASFMTIGLLATTPYLWHRLHRSPVTASKRDRIRLLVPFWTIDVSEFAVIMAARTRLRFRKLSSQPESR